MSKLEDSVNEILGLEKTENKIAVADFEQPIPVPRKIDEKKKNFNEYIHKLKLEQKQFDKQYTNTLTGQEESSRFKLVSNLYILLLLIILI